MTSDIYVNLVKTHLESEELTVTFNRLEEMKGDLLSNWKELSSIYAPSGNELDRARYLVELFRSYGIENAHIDRSGNAVALIDGGGRPTLAFLVTMDDLATVAGLVKNSDEPIEEEGKLRGPGTNIGAICTAGLGLARLFTQNQIKFKGQIYIVGVVQEETGLKGAKGFIEDHKEQLDYVIDVLGGASRISYGGLGIHWFKVHYTGPRGHTLRGMGPNVTKGVARSISRLYNIPLPNETYLNITMMGAGKVYNHKSDDGWHSVDLRSIDDEKLRKVKREIYRVASEVAEKEELGWWIEPFSKTPAGRLSGARDSKLVRIAEEASILLGAEPQLTDRGSSNMNAALSEGIPAIGIGGNRGGKRGTTDEYANIDANMQAIKLNFLIGYILVKGDTDS